jgi:hypothetical protein
MRKKAAELDERAVKALDEGRDTEKAIRWAMMAHELTELALLIEERRRGSLKAAELKTAELKTAELKAAELLGMADERERQLLVTNQGGKNTRMVAAERLRVSKGVSKGRTGGAPDPLVKAANDSGFTLRSLVEKLREKEEWRVSHPYLRQCRMGTSRIKLSLAKRIEELTGFRATKANWPGGWAKED